MQIEQVMPGIVDTFWKARDQGLANRKAIYQKWKAAEKRDAHIKAHREEWIQNRLKELYVALEKLGLKVFVIKGPEDNPHDSVALHYRIAPVAVAPEAYTLPAMISPEKWKLRGTLSVQAKQKMSEDRSEEPRLVLQVGLPFDLRSKIKHTNSTGGLLLIACREGKKPYVLSRMHKLPEDYLGVLNATAGG